jgi:hypothetical protein
MEVRQREIFEKLDYGFKSLECSCLIDGEVEENKASFLLILIKLL